MTITEALRLLELMPPFTEGDVKKAYREAQMVWHPDRFPVNSELQAKAHKRAYLINEAFTEISRALEAGYDFKKISSQPTAKYRKVTRQVAPQSAEDFNKRGFGYLNKGRPNKAIADFTEAIKLEPEVAIYFRNRGLAYANRCKLPNVIADFTEAIRLDPNIRLDPVNACSFRARAKLYELKGEYGKAILDFTEAIQLEPDVADSYFQRGKIYMKTDEYEKAIADFNVVRRLEPRKHFCFRDKFRKHGILCELKGEFAKAIADYSEVIQSFKDGRSDHWCELSNHYFSRARVYRLKSNFDNAIDDYSKAIENTQRSLIPGWQIVAAYYKCRAQTYHEKGDINNAIADLTEAIRLDPKGIWKINNGEITSSKCTSAPNDYGWNHKQAVATLAALYAKTGDFGHAIQYQKHFLQLSELTEEEAINGLRCLKLYEELD